MFVFAVALAFTANAQQNVAKIGLGSAINGTINLEYERVLTDKSSVLAEIGIGIPTDIGETVFEASGVDGTTAEGISVNEGKYSNFYFVGEYRIYTKGEGARGFYFGPYLKLSNYSIDIDGEYNNTAVGLNNIPAEIDVNMFVGAVGAGIGYQWLIGDKFAINWNIVGLGASFNTLNAQFTAADNNVFEAWEQDIRDFLDETALGESIDLSSDNATRVIDATGGAVLPNLRAGISLGYAF